MEILVQEKDERMRQRKEKSAFREYAESIVIAIILALVMRQFVVQAFKIPSGSMQQTLLIGDHILVNKFLYHFTNPQLFDIIVFKYPWEDNRDFIKRVVALPGDRVEMRQKHVYVNDTQLVEPYVRQFSRSHAQPFGPVIVPKKGDIVEIRADKRLYLNDKPVPIPSGSFSPHEFGQQMTGFEVFYGWLFPVGTTVEEPFGPIKVDNDYYFALGDNRDNSKDSRYWGFVKRDRIKGKAFFIYWSWNRQARLIRHVRWERLGKLFGLGPSGRVLVPEKAL